MGTRESKTEENLTTITVEIIADEPALVFSGFFNKKNGVLSNHHFKEAANVEIITDTIDTNTSNYKVFIWTNGLKPLAEPIIK